MPRQRAASKRAEPETNYTIPGLVAIVAIVLLTAIFFAQPRAISSTQAGNAAGLAGDSSSVSSANCDPTSYCENHNKLIRQHTDCQTYVTYCQEGCMETTDGALCR
jgi:hypothetical protein